MIRIITGTLGSGKSYFAVREIIEHVKNGHIVYTNIGLKKTPPGPGEVRPLPDENVSQFHNNIVGGSTDRPTKVLIDEGHLFWSAANQTEQKRTNEELMTFLTMSRRQKVDVDLITQNDSLINIGFRKQATWEVSLKNYGDHPVLKWFPFLRECSVIRFIGGASKSGSPDRISIMRRHAGVWQYYDTEELIAAKPIPVEFKEGLPPVKKSKKGLIIIAVLLAGFYYSMTRVPGMTGKPKGGSPTQQLPIDGYGSPFVPPNTSKLQRPYFESYAAIKKDSSVMCGVSTVVPGQYAFLTTVSGTRLVRIGTQFYGRRITNILPGRGDGGCTLTFDSGEPMLVMNVREFRDVQKNLTKETDDS